MTDKKVVTYSPAYTIVPTYECFNRCNYCNFRTYPGQRKEMDLSAATNIFYGLQNQNVCEILILSGEVHPQSPKRQQWFQRIYDFCALGLQMGYLLHTNAGILSFSEMQQLKQVNVSMGLMLEQLTPKLLQTVHQYAPSKLPSIRLEQLEWAGELQIPFTTGLLLGIGETEDDCWDTLETIGKIHRQYGHIQEVILQPHSPGTQQNWQGKAFNPHNLPEIIHKARQILPSDITIQIPPNLIRDDGWLIACVEAGARDFGGISPKDEVNPDYPHIQAEELQAILQPYRWSLRPRLPVYPQFTEWLPSELKMAVNNWQKIIPIPG